MSCIYCFLTCHNNRSVVTGIIHIHITRFNFAIFCCDLYFGAVTPVFVFLVKMKRKYVSRAQQILELSKKKLKSQCQPRPPSHSLSRTAVWVEHQNENLAAPALHDLVKGAFQNFNVIFKNKLNYATVTGRGRVQLMVMHQSMFSPIGGGGATREYFL